MELALAILDDKALRRFHDFDDDGLAPFQNQIHAHFEYITEKISKTHDKLVYKMKL
jgi:hypothetical protein